MSHKPKSFTGPYLTRPCSRELRELLLTNVSSPTPHLAPSSSMPILRRSRSSIASARQGRRCSDHFNNRMNLPGPNAEFEATLSVIVSNMSSSPKKSVSASRTTSAAATIDRSTRPTSRRSSATTCNNTPTLLPQPKPRPVLGHCDAKANIKYKNEAGRAAVLAVSKTVHYDFGQLNNICNVTIPIEELDALAENPDIEWVDRDGAVYFMQPYRSSK